MQKPKAEVKLDKETVKEVSTQNAFATLSNLHSEGNLKVEGPTSNKEIAQHEINSSTMKVKELEDRMDSILTREENEKGSLGNEESLEEINYQGEMEIISQTQDVDEANTRALNGILNHAPKT